MGCFASAACADDDGAAGNGTKRAATAEFSDDAGFGAVDMGSVPQYWSARKPRACGGSTDVRSDDRIDDRIDDRSEGFRQMVYVSRARHATFQGLVDQTYVGRVTKDRPCPKAKKPCPRQSQGCPCVQPGGNSP